MLTVRDWLLGGGICVAALVALPACGGKGEASATACGKQGEPCCEQQGCLADLKCRQSTCALATPAIDGAACVTPADCVADECLERAAGKICGGACGGGPACRVGESCATKAGGAKACVCLPSTEVCDGLDNDCDGNIDQLDEEAKAWCQEKKPGSYCGHESSGSVACVCNFSSMGLDTECNGACADLSVDTANCGACGKSCSDHASCTAGQCICEAGYVDCNGTCIVLKDNPEHCGACDRRCSEAEDCVEDGCVQRASCLAGELGCAGEGCCTALPVPGGTFMMGRSENGTDAFAEGEPEEQPEHAVTLGPYYLDKYEVTVGRFDRFLAAFDSWRARGNPEKGSGASPNLAGSGWLQDQGISSLAGTAAELRKALERCSSRDDTPVDRIANAPRNCIEWGVVRAFCIWDGGWLPTEAEWEFAAAGGDENRLYPWGTEAPDPAAYALFANWMGYPPNAVGQRPLGNGRYGHADLAGSLAEFTVGVGRAPYSAEPCAANCGTVPHDTQPAAIRGGSYFGYAAQIGQLRSAARDWFATVGSTLNGFRCARAQSRSKDQSHF